MASPFYGGGIGLTPSAAANPAALALLMAMRARRYGLHGRGFRYSSGNISGYSASSSSRQ